MDGYLKQSTAATIKAGPFVDDSDGKTAETGLTISQADVRLSKNGGDFAQKNESSTATHDENGYYSISLDATDTNTIGRLKVAISESGALPVWHTYIVLPANVYDSLIAGSDCLQTDAQQIEGSDATDQIRDAVVDDATRIDASALNTLSSHAPDNTIADVDDVPSAANVADAVWDEAASGHTTGGTYGDKLQSKVPSATIGDYKADVSNLDVAVSTRSSHSAADVWSVATRTLTSFGTLVSDIWSHTTRTLTSFGTLITDIWHHLTSSITTTGGIGKQIKDNLDTTVSSRSDFDESSDKVTLTDATETQIDNIEADTNELQGLISGSKMAAQIKGADANVITASAFATDAVNEIRDAIMGKAVDGSIDVEECLRILLAVLAGDMAKSENTYTYKDQSGNTKVTAAVSDSAVERTIA